MPQISQRTVSHMVRIVRQLYRPWDDFSLPIVSADEMYWDLYAEDFDARDLDFWRERYDWRFEFLLPRLYDGRAFVEQDAQVAPSPELRRSLEVQEPKPEQIGRGRQFVLRLGKYVQKKLSGMPAHLPELHAAREILVRSLELDGFSLVAGELVPSDSAVTEQTKQVALLVQLIKECSFRNESMAIHHYQQAEELYVQQKWDPCIGELRKFFEPVLRDIASETSKNRKETNPSTGPIRDVFDYLQACGFFDADEKTAVGAVWGFLSSGSHPGIAPDHKASLALLLSLGFVQIVVLKFLDWRKNSYHGFLIK